MEDSRSVLHNSGERLGNPIAEDHHCHDHPHFTPTCESCQRARAAFQPYHNVDPHPPTPSRSFQSNMGPAFPGPPTISVKDQLKIGVISGVTRSLIDLLFGR